MATTAASLSKAPSISQDESAFASVFAPVSFTVPTPETTPSIGSYVSPGRPFGGPLAQTSNASDREVQFSRMWSAATRYLKLPMVSDGAVLSSNHEALQALIFIASEPSMQKNLIEWYTHEIDIHFRASVEPELKVWQNPISLKNTSAVLEGTIEILQKAKTLYLARISLTATESRNLPRYADTIAAFVHAVNRNLDSLIVRSLPTQRLSRTLTCVMFEQMRRSLQQHSNPEKCLKNGECQCQVSLSGFPLDRLHVVGLGGSVSEQSFAHATNKFLAGPAVERRCFQVDWTGHQTVIDKLRKWVTLCFVPGAEQALRALTGNTNYKLTSQDLKQFDVMAVSNLGRSRTSSLFDYVKAWPDSTGAILDIRTYINVMEQIDASGPSEKAYVCQSFVDQTQRRLLHTGASTSEILGMYVNIIHAFKALDARGVLLGKVVIPIRNYLRSRDDTASIIAASFLADPDQDQSLTASAEDKICLDVAHEVASSTLQENQDHKLLNWNDLEWTPDPIDAGPDYRSSKSDDVVAYILRLFEQEDFIKEITTALAQLLLYTADHEYARETRLIELLKSRLDATKLQAAEVMLQDVRSSVILNKRIGLLAGNGVSPQSVPTPLEIQEAIPEGGIKISALYDIFASRITRPEFLAMVKLVSIRRNDRHFPKRSRLPPNRKKMSTEMNFKTQVVSSFFWPQLRENEFRMPNALQSIQSKFDERFRHMGSQRKLLFRPAVSRVCLDLELEDRTIVESDLPGWRASVIDAFAEKSVDSNGLMLEDLVRVLEMDESLVQDALNFWTSKRVLYQTSPEVYAVLERLDMDDGPSDPVNEGGSGPAEEVSAVRSQDALFKEGAPMFQAFIANMLQNSGAKEVDGPMGITAVLRMVNPAFIYGDEEVLWLLTDMEGRGEVQRNGASWAPT